MALSTIGHGRNARPWPLCSFLPNLGGCHRCGPRWVREPRRGVGRWDAESTYLPLLPLEVSGVVEPVPLPVVPVLPGVELVDPLPALPEPP